MVVHVHPDPFERRQVARWLLGAFEVLLATAIVSSAMGWLGVALAVVLSNAIGNDLGGTLLSAFVWGPFFALAGAYLTLRAIAR